MLLDWLIPDAWHRRRAAALLVRVDADPSEENLTRVERWRQSGPRQAEALRKAEAVLGAANLLRTPATSISAPARRAANSRRTALAAGLAAALLVPAAWFAFGSWQGAQANILMLRTDVGEIRTVTLADGSTLVLDTASAARVEISRNKRSLRLDAGRARLSIAPGAVQFDIRTGDIHASGSQAMIEVSNWSGVSNLALLSGSARVQAAGVPATPVTGPAVISSATLGGARTANPIDAGNWISGRLTFDKARIADVVRLANRYSKKQVSLADPAIGEFRVTGVYRAGDSEGLARSFAAAFALEVRRDSSGNLALVRPPRR